MCTRNHFFLNLQIATQPSRTIRDGDESMVVQSEDQLLVLEKISHLTQLRDNLEACVVHKDQHIAQLEAECHALMEESKLHLDVVDKCSTQLRTLEDKLSLSFSDMSDDVISVQAIVGRVAGLVKKYETLLDTHTCHTEHCTQHLDTLNNTLATLNEKVAAYEQEIVSLKTKSSAQDGKINDLEETVSELSMAGKEKEMMEVVMQDEIRQRNREMSMLEEGYTSLEQKVAEAENRAAAVAEERDRRETAEQKVKELTMAVAEAEVLQHFLQKEIFAREYEMSSNAGVVKELSEELEQARKMALELQGEAEEQLNQVLVLKANLATKDYDIDEKEDTIIALKEEIESKEELYSELQDMLATNKTAKTELSHQLQEKSSGVAKLEQEMADVTASLVSHKEMWDRLAREKEVEITCLKDMHTAELEGLKGMWRRHVSVWVMAAGIMALIYKLYNLGISY